ncbi:MAG: T9SS type A sorting domain-containing protein [Bacteroidota bacterium]
MTKIGLTFIFTLSIVSLFSQSALTYKNNALKATTSTSFREIQFVDPGNSGVNLVWDFSKIQFTGTNISASISENVSKSKNGFSEYNLVLNENGNEFFFNFTENGFEEKGYLNHDKTIAMYYTNPIQKMKYPFSFGDQIADTYSGYTVINGSQMNNFMGDYTVEADAFGTLMLPGLMIKNALRVKTTKKWIENNMCSSSELSIVHYLWYAPGYRYPLMNINISETQTGGMIPITKRSASVYNIQQIDNPSLLGLNDAQGYDQSDVSVILFPNPFTEKFSFSYFLAKELAVSIDLFDISGKHSGKVLSTQTQSAGMHKTEISALTYSLTPGIYYLRFIFGNKVLTKKIVKI